MLARIRKAKEQEGFTLIELLVVMIIIGILAAIAIPVFLSQREKARDTSTKADVSTVGKEIATYYVDGTGSVALSQAAVGGDIVVAAPSTTAADGTVTAGGTVATVKVSNGTDLVQVKFSDTTKPSSTWCAELTNAEGDKKTYKYSAAAGLGEGVC